MTYIIIQLIRVNYIVKPETQNIEKKTRKRRETNLQFNPTI